jgi:hypothetical protein
MAPRSLRIRSAKNCAAVRLTRALTRPSVQGQYTAQVTRQLPAIQGVAAGTPSVAAKASKQALIGALPTPSFLADVK